VQENSGRSHIKSPAIQKKEKKVRVVGEGYYFFNLMEKYNT
jgi:hypothetical protein